MFEAISLFDALSVIVTLLLVPVWMQVTKVYQEAVKLREEHAQINKALEKIQDGLQRDSETTGKAITDLQKEHNQHNEVQAKILQLCEIIQRRDK